MISEVKKSLISVAQSQNWWYEGTQQPCSHYQRTTKLTIHSPGYTVSSAEEKE
jgi:hypothetical protein